MTAQTEITNLPDQQARRMRWSAFPPQLKAFVRFWLSFSLAGLLVYLGLFCLGLALPTLSTGLLAVVAIAAGIAILLAVDQQAAEQRDEPEDITFAGLAYVLLTKRLPLLALLLFGLVGTVIVAYYTVTSLLSVEFTGDSGLVIKFPGQTVYYYPVHPYGWQNTRVRLRQGEEFKVGITGTVTPGYLQSIAKLTSTVDAVQWPFSGPEGYDKRLYDELATKGMPHYEHDAGLTVQGYPHNTVIGVIVSGGDPCPRNSHQHARTPCETKDGGQGYARDHDQDILDVLSSDRYPQSVTARQSGELWVTINDADAHRWDNLGLFFLKLTKR
jgi:hypothetical protein